MKNHQKNYKAFLAFKVFFSINLYDIITKIDYFLLLSNQEFNNMLSFLQQETKEVYNFWSLFGVSAHGGASACLLFAAPP